MRNTEVSLLIAVVVSAVLALLARAAYVLGDGAASALWGAALVAWLIFVGVTSVYRITGDKFLVSFLFGTMQETYVSGTANVPELRRLGVQPRCCQRGLLQTDILVLLWPLWHGKYFPMTVVKIVIHATTVYTKQIMPDAPSMPVRVDVTLLFRLSPNIQRFIQAINVLSDGSDLAQEATVCDNLWRAGDANRGEHEHKAPRLAEIVQEAVLETVLQSVRTVAGEHYTWDDVQSKYPNVRDIKSAVPEFQDRIKYDLADREGSMFRQAGLLGKPAVRPRNDEPPPADEVPLGEAALSFDLRIEDVRPEDPNMLTALGRPMAEKLEAEAQKRKGEGEGDRIKEKAVRAGVDPDEIWRGEVVQNVDQVNVYTAGDSITDILKKLFGKS